MSNIVEYGVSQTLQAEFDMLRDTLSMREYEGKRNSELNKKYTAKTIDKLAQYILCRNYGKACLELAYLCWPIVRHQDYTKGLLHFFWIEEAISPSQFRNTIYPLTKHDLQTPSITMNAMGLVISSPTQDFTVSASRVTLLSALLELLVGNIANVLEDIEAHLYTYDTKCVGKLATYLQKKLYEFLKVHLPTANLQQKYRYIHHWVVENIDKQKLNDEAVLNFWSSAINEEGYVKFENALDDIVDYQSAYEQVKNARGIHFSQSDEASLRTQSFELDENVANWLYETIFESNENAIMPPTWLVDAPKFITKKDYACVSRLFELRSTLTQFPLSILRSAVFGQWQNLIIQQARDKRDVLIDRPQQDYTSYLEHLNDWRKQASNTILCCAAILYEQQDVRCLTVLSQGIELLVKPQESQEFRHMLQRLVMTNENNQDKSQLTFSHINRWLLQSKMLNNFFLLAKKALANNNRIGFKHSDYYHEADIYEQGTDHLVRGAQLIHDLTQTVLQQLANTNGQTVSLETFFTSDLFIFKSELVKRHGLEHE
jgi:hypothetical protein